MMGDWAGLMAEPRTEGDQQQIFLAETALCQQTLQPTSGDPKRTQQWKNWHMHQSKTKLF